MKNSFKVHLVNVARYFYSLTTKACFIEYKCKRWRKFYVNHTIVFLTSLHGELLLKGGFSFCHPFFSSFFRFGCGGLFGPDVVKSSFEIRVLLCTTKKVNVVETRDNKVITKIWSLYLKWMVHLMRKS